MDFILKSIRTMFYSIDKVIFGFIDDVYGLLIQISRTSVFSQSAIHAFSKRVYALVGIFMLFKVSVSIITYILNPDEFSDKEKGFTSIIKRVILSLVMLVLCPYVFNEAYELQAIILEENTIMNIIFATPTKRVQENLPNSSYVDNAGDMMQFILLYTFAQPNYAEFTHDKKYDLIDCREPYDYKDGQYVSRTDDDVYAYKLNESCFGKYENDTYVYSGNSGILGQLFEKYGEEIAYQDYAQGVAQQNFSLFFRKNVILARESDGEKRFLINYRYPISTVIGVLTLYFILMFCIDIAVRSVKLGFLQMIAPIPIISYVDPKSGKDGMFSKWLKMCTNTYLELFIRLFSLFFGIYTITLVGEFRDVTTGEIVNDLVVKVFMIIGILIFVKKLPDILKKIVGEGFGDFKFTANPFKKISEEAFGGKQLIGAGAAGLAGAAAFGTNAVTGLANKRGIIGSLGSAIAGGFSATGRGLVGAAKGEKFGKNFSNSYSGSMQAKQSRQDRIDDGVSWGEMMASKVQQTVGLHTKGDTVTAAQDRVKSIQDSYKSMRAAAEGRDDAARSVTATFTDRHGNVSTRQFNGIKDITKYREQLAGTKIDRNAYANQNDYLAAVQEQQNALKSIDDAIDARLNSLADGTASTGHADTDAAIRGGYKQMRQAASELDSLTSSIGGEFGQASAATTAKDINGTTKGIDTQLAGSEAATHAKTVDKYGAKKGQK